MSDTTANDLTPMPARGSSAAGGSNSLSGLRGVAQNVRSFTAQPAVAKSLPLVGFIGLLGIAAMVWMLFSAAPSRTLFAGLPDSEKAAVVEALTAAGVPNTMDRATGAINVSEDDYHRARMLLAGRGLPRSGPDGGEVLTSMPLGASRAVETERIRSANELDLARTIEGIDVVQSARVHIAVEAPSVFVRNRNQPAASVMLTLASGRTLGESQVQAIVNLMASSVPGLAPEGVSVVDQNGRLLSRTASEGATGQSERQLSIQTAIEDRYRQAVTAMLTPIVGAGNFTAEVHAEMDFSEVQATREAFPENQRTLQREEGQLSTDAGGASGTNGSTAGGIPGALSNQAPPPATASSTPGGAAPAAAAPGGTAAEVAGAVASAITGTRTENYSRNFAVGREVSVTRQQAGTVKRLTVAVALRNPAGAPARGRQELESLEQLVKGAVGFDQARGDVVALNARTFAPTEEPAVSWWDEPWVAMAVRNGTALLLTLLLVFGIGRPLLKKSTAFFAQRAESNRATRSAMGGEIASVLADRARSDLEMKVSLEMIEATRDYEQRAGLIRTFVRQDPARAALVVRDLIRTDTGVERNG
jgi:flagellar M-ring protein FliF